MTGSPEPPVVAAIVERTGRYLICRRSLERRHGGRWEFPGGKVRPGESMEDAVSRELAEELRVSVVEVSPSIFQAVDPASTLTIFFLPTRITGEPQPQPLEHEEIAWASIDELKQFALAPSDRKFALFLAEREGGR